MAKKQSYIKESYEELVKKVTWPSWSELQNSSINIAGQDISLGGAITSDTIISGITDGTITNDKLAGSITTNKLVDNIITNDN